jgi:hypothetical protein
MSGSTEKLNPDLVGNPMALSPRRPVRPDELLANEKVPRLGEKFVEAVQKPREGPPSRSWLTRVRSKWFCHVEATQQESAASTRMRLLDPDSHQRKRHVDAMLS